MPSYVKHRETSNEKVMAKCFVICARRSNELALRTYRPHYESSCALVNLTSFDDSCRKGVSSVIQSRDNQLVDNLSCNV